MDKKQLKLSTFDEALQQIEDGMVIGIGSGSTIELLIPQLAEKVKADQLNITGVCTSNKTAYIAKNHDIKVIEVNDATHIDLAIDGADEVDTELNLIKGGGGALFREKVIDAMASKFVVLIDESKRVNYLGEVFKLPVEVDKFNWLLVAKKIEAYDNLEVTRRMADDVPFITDNGNYILDVALHKEINSVDFHEYLIHLIGVLETGYFINIADQVIVGTQNGVEIINKES